MLYEVITVGRQCGMTTTFKMFFGSFTLIRRDPMLVLLILAPFIAGGVFRIGLPLLQPVLMNEFALNLTPWYPLADMLRNNFV